MHISIDQLFSDPTFYFHSFDGDSGLFLQLSRDDYYQSIFFDKRIHRTSQTAFRVPIVALLDAMANASPAGPVNMIHHIAQCGSTLLSRALDIPSGGLAIREPSTLRQLGVERGAAGTPAPDAARRLDLTLRLLAKRFESGPVVIKGNVPTVMVADGIEAAKPGEAGILLYYPLEDYLAAVLRTPRHQQWVVNVTRDLRLGAIKGLDQLSELTVAQRAAGLWAVLLRRFAQLEAANRRLRALDANRFFDDPAETLRAAAELLGLPLDEAEIARRVSGPLFASYSKNPGMTYAEGQREARRAETLAEQAEAIRGAREWLTERRDDLGVPEALTRPLVGEGAPLF